MRAKCDFWTKLLIKAKPVDSYSAYLKAPPDAEGRQAVLKAMGGAGGTSELKVELERQAKTLANHAWNVAQTFGRQGALEKQAEGLWGLR